MEISCEAHAQNSRNFFEKKRTKKKRGKNPRQLSRRLPKSTRIRLSLSGVRLCIHSPAVKWKYCRSCSLRIVGSDFWTLKLARNVLIPRGTQFDKLAENFKSPRGRLAGGSSTFHFTRIDSRSFNYLAFYYPDVYQGEASERIFNTFDTGIIYIWNYLSNAFAFTIFFLFFNTVECICNYTVILNYKLRASQ